MSHGTEHHLEHAEHAKHQANDPFDRRVAVSMAILAAVLAGVTLASHRGHTETLLMATDATALRTQAGNKRTDADTLHTQANDQWSFYQAKNIRSHEYQAFLLMDMLIHPDGSKQDAKSKALRDYWITQVERYEGDNYWTDYLTSLENYKDRGKFGATSEFVKDLSAKQKGKKPEYKNSDLALIQAEARKLTAAAEKLKHEAEEVDKKAEVRNHESHELHAKVTWIDLGHLGLELALVFCAVAMLRKQRTYWLTGLTVGAVAAGLAGFGIIGWWTLGAATGAHH